MFLICNDTIIQAYAFAECAMQHLDEQIYIVLLQVLIHKGAGHLYQQSLLRIVERFEDYWSKPCIVLLLANVLADERKSIVPTSIRTCFHL